MGRVLVTVAQAATTWTNIHLLTPADTCNCRANVGKMWARIPVWPSARPSLSPDWMHIAQDGWLTRGPENGLPDLGLEDDHTTAASSCDVDVAWSSALVNLRAVQTLLSNGINTLE